MRKFTLTRISQAFLLRATPGTGWTCNTRIWPLGGSVDPEIARSFDEAKTAMKKLKEDDDGHFAWLTTNRNNATSFNGANVT